MNADRILKKWQVIKQMMIKNNPTTVKKFHIQNRVTGPATGKIDDHCFKNISCGNPK
jgi:hypothetical protein